LGCCGPFSFFAFLRTERSGPAGHFLISFLKAPCHTHGRVMHSKLLRPFWVFGVWKRKRPWKKKRPYTL